MFFNIGHTPLENYPCHWQLGSFVVSTDQGWHLNTSGPTKILYKGYADTNSMGQLLEQIAVQVEPKLTGNFCALVWSDDCIKIQTDRYRSFPIYVDDGVNNLLPKGRTVWTDGLITVYADLSVTQTNFDVVGKIDTSELSYDHVLKSIIEKLDVQTQLFLSHTTLPINAFLSGGVDTLLVYSFLKKHTQNFNLVRAYHLDWDYFWIKNHGDITKHWGYTQIHHWLNDCVLTSGAPGDEFTLRSPYTADLFLKHHNVYIRDLIKSSQWKNCLHKEYFCLPQHQEVFDNQQPLECSLEQLHWNLCNNIVNDWQHWHLGKTLTWTPLRDLEIFKLILRLPLDRATDQIMNSQLCIDIIEHNCPGLSQVISTQKNTGNYMSNLTDFVT